MHRSLLLLRAIMRNSCLAKVTTFLRTAFDQVVCRRHFLIRLLDFFSRSFNLFFLRVEIC